MDLARLLHGPRAKRYAKMPGSRPVLSAKRSRGVPKASSIDTQRFAIGGIRRNARGRKASNILGAACSDEVPSRGSAIRKAALYLGSLAA